MNKPIHIYPILIVVLVLISAYASPTTIDENNLTITFRNTANGKLVVLNDSMYTTPFNETYSIKKLKYYISNIELEAEQKKISEKESYHLVDASRNNSFSLTIPPGKYSSIRFIAGVDSSRNCSGAQVGALDPLNDMFWTWNTGYVMFKLEGRSPSSNADMNRIEHHIGGFKSPNSTIRNVNLSFKNTLVISKGIPAEIIIETNIDNYWNGVNEIRISNIPVNTTVGEKAKKSADNFPGMFSLVNAIVF